MNEREKFKKDFELDLLKEFQDDGCGGDCFDEIGMLVGHENERLLSRCRR